MRNKIAGFAIIALFASWASGQPQAEPRLERTLPITHSETAQGLEEVATNLRAMTGISSATGMTESDVTIDYARKTITLRGTAGQIALGEWLVNALDTPDQNRGTREYRLPEFGKRPACLAAGWPR
jgi:hypothetical protein